MIGLLKIKIFDNLDKVAKNLMTLIIMEDTCFPRYKKGSRS